MAKTPIARGVAVGFLAARWEVSEMVRSAQRIFQKPQVWLPKLAEKCVGEFQHKPTLAALEKLVGTDEAFRLAVKVNNIKSVRVSKVLMGRQVVTVEWGTPEIANTEALASWLELGRSELDWLANIHPSDPGHWNHGGKHYVCTWIRKRVEGIRLIESPKPLLKAAQRKIHEGILSRIAEHTAAHGFCKGRSVVSYVQPHVNRPVCLKMDLKDFFPSIRFGRVSGLFQLAGYGHDVARHLAALCTCSTGLETIERTDTGSFQQSQALARLFLRRHLPQGAPTSPAISNLIAFHLDARLSGLSGSANASFTRYADDLLFSGDDRLARCAKRFETTVGAIAIEEGFAVNFRKTRLMRAAQRQHATGIVLNESTNLSRVEFDRLKATLFNCVRHGPREQNRNAVADFRSHLGGRIEWLRQLNPRRAEKLQAIFARIDWG